MYWKRTPLFSLPIACRGSSCTRPHSPAPPPRKGLGESDPPWQCETPTGPAACARGSPARDVDTLPLDLAPGRGASSASWQHTERFRVWTPEPACLGSGPSTSTYQLGAQERLLHQCTPRLFTLHLPCVQLCSGDRQAGAPSVVRGNVGSAVESDKSYQVKEARARGWGAGRGCWGGAGRLHYERGWHLGTEGGRG